MVMGSLLRNQLRISLLFSGPDEQEETCPTEAVLSGDSLAFAFLVASHLPLLLAEPVWNVPELLGTQGIPGLVTAMTIPLSF